MRRSYVFLVKASPEKTKNENDESHRENGNSLLLPSSTQLNNETLPERSYNKADKALYMEDVFLVSTNSKKSQPPRASY
jgi:hypothetical protein